MSSQNKINRPKVPHDGVSVCLGGGGGRACAISRLNMRVSLKLLIAQISLALYEVSSIALNN